MSGETLSVRAASNPCTSASRPREHQSLPPGQLSSVSGGNNNHAAGTRSSVTGGSWNDANGVTSAVTGGTLNSADNQHSAVSGGYDNIASGNASSISGGRHHRVPETFGWAAGRN